MSMRLQEVHPALVHFPIALLPVSLAADALGRATGSQSLLDMGRRTMPLAAASAALAGVFGLIAQEAVNPDDHTMEQLITHRNLNLGVMALTAVMAAKRSRRRKPGLGYLAAGLAGMATMTYSAYLGGHMVYEHGLGVRKAGGLVEEQAPEIRPDTMGEVLSRTQSHLKTGAEHLLEETREGKLAPWLTESGHPEGAGQA